MPRPQFIHQYEEQGRLVPFFMAPHGPRTGPGLSGSWLEHPAPHRVRGVPPRFCRQGERRRPAGSVWHPA